MQKLRKRICEDFPELGNASIGFRARAVCRLWAVSEESRGERAWLDDHRLHAQAAELVVQNFGIGFQSKFTGAVERTGGK